MTFKWPQNAFLGDLHPFWVHFGRFPPHFGASEAFWGSKMGPKWPKNDQNCVKNEKFLTFQNGPKWIKVTFKWSKMRSVASRGVAFVRRNAGRGSYLIWPWAQNRKNALFGFRFWRAYTPAGCPKPSAFNSKFCYVPIPHHPGVKPVETCLFLILGATSFFFLLSGNDQSGQKIPKSQKIHFDLRKIPKMAEIAKN